MRYSSALEEIGCQGCKKNCKRSHILLCKDYFVAYVIKADRKLGFVKMAVALRPSAVTETYTEMMSYTKLIQYIQSESVVMAKVKGGLADVQ